MLAREGCAFVPGGGVAYDSVKALVSHGRSYIQGRTEERINDFHSSLLTGQKKEPTFQEFIKKPFKIDDYYALLASCVQDIEDEKVEAYSTLMKSLIESELSQEERRHFIKSCKELSFSEIKFLRHIYINSLFDLMPEANIQRQINRILTLRQDNRASHKTITGNTCTPK